MTILQKYLCSALFLLLFVQCKSDLRQAEDSLEGSWTVVEIYTTYGNNTANGILYGEQFTETGNLGTFTFTETQVDYQFTRRDTLTAEVSDWVLNREKVQEGFVSVEQYTLDLAKMDFRCEFGDGTSDAEKEAENIVLSFENTAIGPFTEYQLFLMKDE